MHDGKNGGKYVFFYAFIACANKSLKYSANPMRCPGASQAEPWNCKKEDIAQTKLFSLFLSKESEKGELVSR
jgi:hypothetical protein